MLFGIERLQRDWIWNVARILEAVGPVTKVTRTRETRVTHVRKLSRTTNVRDCARIVYNYLLSMGRLPQQQIGDVEVWVGYEGRKAVVAGPSQQAVEAWRAADRAAAKTAPLDRKATGR